MVENPKVVFVSNPDKPDEIEIFDDDSVTLAELKRTRPGYHIEKIIWEHCSVEEIWKALENAAVSELPEEKQSPQRRIGGISRFLDAATREDLQLILHDLARECRQMRHAGVRRWRIEIRIIHELARTLMGIVCEKLKEKFEPVLRFWR